ncbi:altered inheritance of mitochondria protein 11 [Scheffersomyces coipomensis]|uniref:altered inheritance of mitochondria protein 11 n=1 Tax=Scheffersomyces coipomensis TaxID=1788519 RepID=UPI00315DB880
MSDVTHTPSAIRSFLTKYNFKLGEASDAYIQRRKQQMVLFMTASAITIFASRFAYKSTITRQYVPTLFQGNHHPPTSYNFTHDAAVAVGTGTLLCGSVSSMIIFGSAWIIDVSNLKEFNWRMKLLLGGHQKEVELSKLPLDEESAYIQDSLNDILEGKYDEVDEQSS